MKLRSIARSSLAALWLAATVAFGQAAAETPATFIERLGYDAIGALQNPNLTMDQRSEVFRRILEEGFDMEAMGRFVLGDGVRNGAPRVSRAISRTDFPHL